MYTPEAYPRAVWRLREVEFIEGDPPKIPIAFAVASRWAKIGVAIAMNSTKLIHTSDLLKNDFCMIKLRKIKLLSAMALSWNGIVERHKEAKFDDVIWHFAYPQI